MEIVIRNMKEKLNIWLAYVSYPATTAVYFERALRKDHNVLTIGPTLPDELVEGWDLKGLKDKIKPHDVQCGYEPDMFQLKQQFPQLPQPDLFLWVESVYGYFPKNINNLNCPTACYLIDSHMNLQHHLQWAKDYDYVFIAQKEYLPIFKEHVHNNIFWLPLGADPDIHSKHNVEKEFDVGFVGSITSEVHKRRAELLNKISSVAKVEYKRCFLEEMAEHFSKSKIIFNNAIKNDLNMRVFEGMSIGSLLLTDETHGSGQLEMFKDGEDYVLYNDENIVEKVKYYLEHDEEREKIAKAGRERILRAHTYKHRTDELIKVITGEKSDTNSPEDWRKLSESPSTTTVEKNEIKVNSSKPERSFIIPVLDYAPFSEFNIKTLLNDLEDVDGEVIVVFNSMDVFNEMKDHPRIDQFAAIKKNVGVSRAWNIGLNIARAKTSFILNSDLHIEPRTIYDLEEALEKLPMAAIVGPQGSYIDFEKMELLKYFEPGKFDKPVKVDEISGFLFAVKTELFNSSVIHFDNTYTPCYSEEWDIALQCKMAGLNLYAVPTDGYTHHWGGTVGTLDREIEYYDEKETAQNLLIKHREIFLKKWKALESFSENKNLLVSYWAEEKLSQAQEVMNEQPELAIGILSEVIGRFPNYVDALEISAKLLVKIGKYEEAMKYLAHLENIAPDHKIDIQNFSNIGLIKQQVI